MKRLIPVLFLLAIFTATQTLADPRTAFDEGLRRYRENDISGAISAWENTASRSTVSGALLYNLGNAYYRQGQIGKAILYYERARTLLPRDGDVKTNLDLARLAVVDRIEKPVRLPVWDWLDAVRDALSLPELARLFHIAGLFAVLSLAGALFATQRLKRAIQVFSAVMLVLFTVTGAWYAWRAALDSREFAIIIVNKTDVRSAPDEASQELFSLHEGTKIRCVERLGQWVNIQIADNRKGWMSVEDAEAI